MATQTEPTALDADHALTAWHWERQPDAAAFVDRQAAAFLAALPDAAAFADRLYRETGNRFTDQIDLIAFGDRASYAAALAAGWTEDHGLHAAGPFTLAVNPSGMFPKVALNTDAKPGEVLIDLKVERVADFLAAHGLDREIGGAEHAAHRWTNVWSNDTHTLGVVERHGYAGVGQPPEPDADAAVIEAVRESFRHRPREDEDFDTLDKLVADAIAAVGRDRACDLFFAAEREYWQGRNAVARWQKARQDKLGIGWANHDHHTYRSSRRHFHRLVRLWESLGFHCRERFYPGEAAGWGAQVMEQPACGLVTFNDVDISVGELKSDFAHEPMNERGSLATVGLWCALHGESVMKAGMHHLECTFDFDALKDQMAADGHETMPAFSDFPHLKQAFTKGERWDVAEERIADLLARGLITENQARDFRDRGAIGSHLENLERNDGFKGFNQTGVTEIIQRVDPRKQ